VLVFDTARKLTRRIKGQLDGNRDAAHLRADDRRLVSSNLLTLIVIPSIYAVAKGIEIRSPRLAATLQQT
jgi:hypothetical protein